MPIYSAADDALAHGETRGPFHGVPFTVKDIFDVAGVRFRYGSGGACGAYAGA
jgi:Asp-tRNA(Asn)/Glu-tRNA(Gln) amidotransferase A subunit family amidase